MDRHGHLGRADTEDLDRPRRATNKCNGPEIEMVSECDNSVLWRRFEIDRERVIAIWRFDRSHGGTCAISSHDPQRKWSLYPLIQEREEGNSGSLPLRQAHSSTFVARTSSHRFSEFPDKTGHA